MTDADPVRARPWVDSWCGAPWRAFRRILVDPGRYDTPGYLRVIDRAAKILSLPWLVLLVWLFYALALQLIDPIPTTEHAEGRRAYFYALGLTITGLGALLAAPLVLVRTFINDRQAQAVEEQRRIQQEQRDIAEQNHFTSLYSTAIGQLGAGTVLTTDGAETVVPTIEIRMGAIYALERIANQSDADYRPVMETLCAYIRRNSGPAIDVRLPDAPDQDDSRPSARPHHGPTSIREIRQAVIGRGAERADVQAALSVLSRRPISRRMLEGFSTDEPPDLSHKGDSGDFAPPLHGDTRKRILELHDDVADIFERGLRRSAENIRQSTRKRPENMARFLEELREWKDPKPEHTADPWTPDLAGAVLQAFVLDGADLRRLNLHGARMEGVCLSGGRLQGANLEEARLDFAFLAGADLRGANLQRARLVRASLLGATMDGAILRGAKLQGADFSCARLGGVEFDWTCADGADFSGAHMERAYLGGAQLKGASLRGADLEEAEMGRPGLPFPFLEMDELAPSTPLTLFEDVRFITLMRAHQAANLSGARLVGADLRAVLMDAAILEGADLGLASLKAADLSKAKGLTQSQVDAAFGDGSVRLPEGIERPAHWRPENLNDEAYYGRFRSWITSRQKPWPHSSVFGYWARVEPIGFEDASAPGEAIEL